MNSSSQLVRCELQIEALNLALSREYAHLSHHSVRHALTVHAQHLACSFHVTVKNMTYSHCAHRPSLIA